MSDILVRAITRDGMVHAAAVFTKDTVERARQIHKTLPVANGKRIAVVGRYADKINVGDHGSSRVYSPYTVTAFEGIKNRFGAENVVVYNGCDIAKATETVKDCDYIIACVGSDYKQEGEFLVNRGNIKQKPIGKGGDRVNLRVPEEDVASLKPCQKKAKSLWLM